LSTRVEFALSMRRIAALPREWSANVRGDAMGGVLAAVVTLPLAIGFGILAFAPLGESYLTAGILAGLYGAIFTGLVAIVGGANTTAIYVPRSLVAFMIGSVALHTIAESSAPLMYADPWFPVAALLITMALAGLVQLVFGVAGFGALMKFIPSPVMAGFQNAAALLILYSQLHVMLGLPKRLPAAEILFALPEAKLLNLLLGLATMLAIWHGARIARRVPPALTGLAVGTMLYYLLVAMGLERFLGPVIGRTPVVLLDGTYVAEIMRFAAQPGFLELLPSLAAAGFSVAVVASLDVLICARILEGLTGRRTDGNRELRNIGAANLVTPLMGGLAGAISLSSSTASFKGGARSTLSALVHSVVILAAVVLLPPLLGRLPLIVVGALLCVTALQLVDRWTLRLAAKILRREALDWRRAALDLVVIALVTVIAVVGDIVSAVLVGVGIAVAFFVLRMSRSVIRREYHADAVHSRRTRDEADMTVLGSQGGRILVLELEGPLFFGSAEMLAKRMELASRSGAQCVILDFKRVNEIDSTGALFLAQSNDRIRQVGRVLLLAGAGETRSTEAALRDAGVLAAIGRERVFADVDHALEWAEDQLIADAGALRADGEFPFERMDLVRGFEAHELEEFRAALEQRTYGKGDFLVQEGEDGDELYILAKGSASVHLRLPGHARRERIITFSAGTAFGEFALLDRETRSASVVADEEVACYVLSRETFDRLARERKDIAVKLLTNLGRELSLRLRRANRMLAQID
jgi:SulP family sulfate permease